VNAGEFPYRMKDLMEQTGLSRQAIHFYIQQGLLPEGKKTGRNMAWYGPEHVTRLLQVRRLQEEMFLPLKAIRAVLDAETEGLDPAKRALLADVGTRLDSTLGRTRPGMVDADDACARRGVPRADLDRMAELGLVVARDGLVTEDSLWLLDLWGQLRAAGFTDKLGFTVDDLQIYEEAIAALFKREYAMIIGRIAGLPPERLAEMLQRGLPLVHSVLVHFHTAHVQNYFATLTEER
jgi:DNA-binding transcriptional MerR regulator